MDCNLKPNIMKKPFLLSLIWILVVFSSYGQKSSEILPVLNVDAGINPSNIVFIIDGTNYWGKTSRSNLELTINQVTSLQGTLDAKYPLIGNPSGFLTSISFTGKTTTDLNEGTNLYFTNTRSRSAISLTTTGLGIATYNNITGILNIPITKTSIPYSGVTNGSGNYTVVFSIPYFVTPNIQVCLINPNVRDTPVPVVSTTGFTVNVQRRVDVLGLLPTYSNVVGGAVNVLITEN